MICKATTTLKKADTDGRIPAYTLDQYVRNELSKQLIEAVKPALSVSRHDTDAPTVDFGAELIVLTPAQWNELKTVLAQSIPDIAPEQQGAIRRWMTDVEPGS